jgi:hypothetical protein
LITSARGARNNGFDFADCAFGGANQMPDIEHLLNMEIGG